MFCDPDVTVPASTYAAIPHNNFHEREGVSFACVMTRSNSSMSLSRYDKTNKTNFLLAVQTTLLLCEAGGFHDRSNSSLKHTGTSRVVQALHFSTAGNQGIIVATPEDLLLAQPTVSQRGGVL